MPCCTIYEYRNTSQTHAKIGRSVRILDELLYPQLSFPHLKTCSASIKAALPRGTRGLTIPKPSANPSQGRISPSIIASPPALGSAILCVLNSHEGCFSDTVRRKQSADRKTSIIVFLFALCQFQFFGKLRQRGTSYCCRRRRKFGHRTQEVSDDRQNKGIR